MSAQAQRTHRPCIATQSRIRTYPNGGRNLWTSATERAWGPRSLVTFARCGARGTNLRSNSDSASSSVAVGSGSDRSTRERSGIAHAGSERLARPDVTCDCSAGVTERHKNGGAEVGGSDVETRS